MLAYDTWNGPQGRMTLVAAEDGLAGIYFARQKHYPVSRREWLRDPRHPVLRRAKKELTEYFAGRRRRFTLPLAPAGTAFQKAVWKAIAAVPFGRTLTYGELARRAGHPGSARAAGAATGRNPLSVVVPCHRILGADGGLTGYAGGLARKRVLLALEGVEGTKG